MITKNQSVTLTLENIRMLNFDDFINYSSYTTKIYMKSMGVRLEILLANGPLPSFSKPADILLF